MPKGLKSLAVIEFAGKVKNERSEFERNSQEKRLKVLSRSFKPYFAEKKRKGANNRNEQINSSRFFSLRITLNVYQMKHSCGNDRRQKTPVKRQKGTQKRNRRSFAKGLKRRKKDIGEKSTVDNSSFCGRCYF